MSRLVKPLAIMMQLALAASLTLAVVPAKDNGRERITQDD